MDSGTILCASWGVVCVATTPSQNGYIFLSNVFAGLVCGNIDQESIGDRIIESKAFLRIRDSYTIFGSSDSKRQSCKRS